MQVQSVNAKTLKQWMDAGDVVVIDVREPEEYAVQNIAGTTLIPLGEFQFQSLPDLNHKKLVIHCLSGKRSLCACERVLEAKPDCQVYNLEGGILAWADTGYPTEAG